MGIKNKIAQQASDFYKENITPYEFIISSIDKSDFTISQIIKDDASSGILSVNSQSYYVFVFQIHPSALNKHYIESLNLPQYYIPKKEEEEEDQAKNLYKPPKSDDDEEMKESSSL